MTMEDDILIDNYLKGLLSENEVQSFLERLESDADFNEKFKLEKQLFEALNDETWNFQKTETQETEDYKKILEGDDLQNLKKTLKKVNSELNSLPKNKSRRPFYYLAAAIVVLLSFQFFFNQSNSTQDLYNEFVNINDLPSFISRSNSKNNTRKRLKFLNR